MKLVSFMSLELEVIFGEELDVSMLVDVSIFTL